MPRVQKPQRPTVRPIMVEDLARVYTQEREALLRRAIRKVHDSALAEEIVQEAFLKCMLAAPEIADTDHLAAYLNTTVNNLCISNARAVGVRPDLVAIDSETTAAEVANIIDSNVIHMDDALVAGEDSAIVREAISRLSEADRAVLLAEAFEDLSAQEIASKYGVSTDYVYNALARARKNLRNVLETWVIDEESGMTAAQFLSKSYKSAKENSKKIGSAALSLVLLVAAFFGFWNNPSTPVQIAAPPVTTKTSPQPSASATTPSVTTPQATPEEMKAWAIDYLSKTGPLGWPGLDGEGIPQGFTVNNGAGLSGLALISTEPFVMDTETGTVSTQSRFTTFQDGLNVILDQTVSNISGRLFYEVNPIVRVSGSWVALSIDSRSVEIKKLSDGRYLITAWMIVDINKTAAGTPIAGLSLGGQDLKNIPAVIATRLITTEIGTPINGQAVQVLDPLAGQ